MHLQSICMKDFLYGEALCFKLAVLIMKYSSVIPTGPFQIGIFYDFMILTSSETSI